MCVLGTQAAPSTGWMLWCLEATGSTSTPSASHWLGMDKGIYTSSGGLAVLWKLSDNGTKALCVVFKILEKNSHQAFLLLWSVSGGKEKRKRKRIPKTNKICLTLGMAKLHTWACFTSGYVSVGQATRWTADEIIRSEKGPHLPEGSMLSWHCKGLQMGWNREYLCFGSCALYCMLVCMCEQKKKSLTFSVCRLLGFFWVVLV